MVWLWLSGCAGPDPSRWLPGGDTTNELLGGSNAFLMPSANLSPEHELDFYSGNSFFNQAWVEAPASTAARDGLGPLFLARSCSGCHLRDGKGAPPEDGQGPFVGLLLRLSGPEGEPHPVYGDQLQDQGLPGVPAEAVPSITWEAQAGRFDDGTAYTLMAPRYALAAEGYGPLPAGLLVSPRVAPHMIGLGLLEAIDGSDLEAAADPDDADGDGVRGRVQRWGGAIGRFGWKGDAVDVEAQVAGAFVGDMGLTSRVHPEDGCTAAQAACRAATSGGEPEVSDEIFDLVVLYSRTVAPPARRLADDPEVRRGERLFGRIGCDACHTPSHVTGASPLPELEGQTIWPYTDLLLHDLGAGLADGRPLGEASGTAWRTAPLWGVGRIPEVSGHSRYLHDGRARSLEEAILWHGGEAERSADRYRGLTAAERAAVLMFVGDL